MPLAIALVILAAGSVTSFLECFNTDMESRPCHPMQLWCVKWENGTTVSRGCADVVICPDEEEGCFPEHSKESAVRWCCCNTNLCNLSPSSKSLYLVFAIIVILLA
ncbi:unnamed protein product [Cylicocyclus nassatus]|uniref:Uncharacterized protein n=1 Tax=Cylicocyclus nassatus TaxID=53992 RepID=A0AA36DPI2_CYLNA|nr:unnamed protein product [Cylicocyclus nassatus]